ncbi:hypothetical protein HAX54_022104 [Datura stramonium]|uniref:Uncharacterized protein n=1 Tax=Datura stramonium TaxID=4076 RepID=A0ABS8UTZ6_DATST|nr:hypothetical protein [Datura stramonium]
MASETSPSPSTEGNQLSDNLILDTPLSSNPSSSPSGTDTQHSPSSKMHSPKVVPVNPTAISHGGDNTRGDGTGVSVDGLVVAKEGTEVLQKEGSDFSIENMFEGGLTESREGMSNILQSEAEIIEEFINALSIREKEVGEGSPSAEGSRLASGVGNYPFIQESGEPSSQEAPTVVASPKWDGTPTQPDVGVLETSAPSGIAEGNSSPLDDDEISSHLVFKRKSRSASRLSLQGSTGTQGGPATRGTVKKSLDLILGRVSKKGKKLAVVEKPAEGPSVPVLRSKKKHFYDKSSKGWEHLFALPMPIMYEAEVTEFYASPSFTDDDETVFAKVGGVELEFDSISLGKILDMHTAGEFTVKDKQATRDFHKMIGKL